MNPKSTENQVIPIKNFVQQLYMINNPARMIKALIPFTINNRFHVFSPYNQVYACINTAIVLEKDSGFILPTSSVFL